MLDNHDNGSKLTFTVYGTIAGAEVRLYAGETQIGYVAEAQDGSTDVTTNGSTDLTDGTEEITITATQTINGKLESAHSTGLSITVDTVAPTVESFTRLYQEWEWTFRPTILSTITIGFSEDVYDSSGTAGAAMALYNISTSQSYSPGYTFSGQETDSLTWIINTTPAAGWYRVTISGSAVKDIAGNAMGSDYVYGNEYPQDAMLVPILGDANLDGVVGYADLSIVMAHMGQSGHWTEGDFDCNGWVNAGDYIIYKQHNGQSVSR